jgi:hypothetical protein
VIAATTGVHLTAQSRILAGVVGVCFCVVILELIRRHRLQERYTALWLLVGIGLAVCGAFPRVLELAANLLGVRDTNVALFAVVIGGLVLVVLHLTVVVSRQSEQITRLAAEPPVPRAPAEERDLTTAGRD